jgi:hypothetical protein
MEEEEILELEAVINLKAEETENRPEVEGVYK